MASRGLVWLLLVLALAGWGCSEKKKVTDPGVGPVGVTDTTNVRLVAWVDSSSVLGVGVARVVHLGVLDRTAANSFAVWRQEPGGGYRSIKDFTRAPSLRFLSQGGEYYEFFDFVDPGASAAVSYVAQGGISGVYGPQSPLSNVATVSASLPLTPATLVALAPVDSAASDSIPRLRWRQVAGAKGYLVQVYQGRTDAKDQDVFDESRFQALYPKSHSFVVAYVPTNPAIAPGDTFSFPVGSAGPTYFEARLSQMLALEFYSWRVVAVDGNNWMMSADPGFPRTFVYAQQLFTLPSAFQVYFARRPLP